MQRIPDEELLDDLRRVAKKIGKSPTAREYSTHGRYSVKPYKNRFDRWNSAKDAAGLSQYPPKNEELLDDLKRVAKKIGKSPTAHEYNTHGRYSVKTYKNRFDRWNSAKDTAGLSQYPRKDEELLYDLRRVAKKIGKSPDIREYSTHGQYGGRTYHSRFGSYWESIIRAGLKPTRNVPLSKKEYDSYIQTAIDASSPSVSLYALLRAFTGMTEDILYEFSLDWVYRLYNELQSPLVRVPPEHTPSNGDWELILPEEYTTNSGDKESTHLKPLIKWMNDTNYIFKSKPLKRGTFIPQLILERAGIDTTTHDLRATVAIHLARRGLSRFEIDMQVGASDTNWVRSIEDFLLYLYQFEDYCHPSYEPNGVYLDPETGEPYTPDSEAD